MYALVLLVHIAAYCGSSVQCSCLVWFLLPPIAYCGSSVQCSSVQFIHCVWNMCNKSIIHILYKSIHDYFILLDTTLK